MEPITHTQEEGKASIEYLDDDNQADHDLKEKERLSAAMSSYYLLYR